MTSNKPHLFWDLDDVFADFEQGYVNNFDHKHNSVDDATMWKTINSIGLKFWTTLPLMPGVDVLLDIVRRHGGTILSGCPASNFEIASEGKHIWRAGVFPLGKEQPIITCLSKEKFLHMKKPGDIIVDDNKRNCRQWREAGGIAIQHNSNDVAATVKALAELGFE